jgi:4-amino-4-deoxy-L-arabinose transferase-like glycosyltransferase
MAASGIFLFAFALYLLPAVCSRPLRPNRPEAHLAAAAEKMVRSGEYAVPRADGEVQPPLPAWLAAAAARVLSGGGDLSPAVMSRAVLLPPALLGALALFVIVLYGSVVFGRPAGVAAGLILGFSLLFCRYAELGGGHMVLACACALTCCSAAWLVSAPCPGFWSALALGLSLGLGLLAGAFIPVLLLAGPLLIEVLIGRRFSGRKVLLFLAALAISVVAASPWLMAIGGPDKSAETCGALMRSTMRALGAEGPVRGGRSYYYLLQLAKAMMPWTILLIAAWPLSLRLCLAGKREVSGPQLLAHNQGRFLVLFFGLGFVLLYALPAQDPSRLLPLLPALALASGYMLGHFKAPGGMAEESLAWTQLLAGLAGGILIALLPLILADGAMVSEISLTPLRQPIGWVVSVPAGLVFFALQFYCARQWVEGKPAAAAVGLGVLAYGGLAAASWFWAHQTF